VGPNSALEGLAQKDAATRAAAVLSRCSWLLLQ